MNLNRHLVLSAAACLVLAAATLPGAAQQVLEVQRGNIEVDVHVKGTVTTEEIITLKSTIHGRIEDVNVSSTGSWVTNEAALGDVASKNLAALLDSPTTTNKSVVIERWKSIYPIIPARCPDDCYLLNILVSPKQWIDPDAPLFRAALVLELEGRVEPVDAHWIHNGQWLTFWAKDRPQRKLRIQIGNFRLDKPGQPLNSGGSFSIALGPEEYLDPGTDWAGLIVPVFRQNVLKVPTAALTDYDGMTFLPVRISTGITTGGWTEITAGVSANQPFLVLDPSKLGKAAPHRPEPEPSPSAAPQQQPSAPSAPQGVDYGEDIYPQ